MILSWTKVLSLNNWEVCKIGKISIYLYVSLILKTDYKKYNVIIRKKKVKKISVLYKYKGILLQ